MAPPTFADLGKSAKDLFNKGYNFGFIKVDSTSKAGEKNEVEFKTAAAHNIGSGKLGGNLDVKYKIPQYGITLTEKWNTENQLGTVVEVNEQFGRGLKLTLDSTYAPHAGKRSGKLKADWSLPSARASSLKLSIDFVIIGYSKRPGRLKANVSHPSFRITADVALTTTPVVNAAGVFSKEGWLFGASAAFDTSSNKLASTSLAFGHQAGNYTLHSFVVNNSDFGASLYHKVCCNVELGAQLGWKVGGNGTDFALATKYAPTRDSIIRAKINNSSLVAVALTHNLSPALKLTLSNQFNLATNDAHKFGLGLEFEPSN